MRDAHISFYLNSHYNSEILILQTTGGGHLLVLSPSALSMRINQNFPQLHEERFAIGGLFSDEFFDMSIR